MPDHDPPRALSFHPSARSIVYFGPFRLDLSDGLLSRAGEEVRLPPRAMTILQHLVERAGRIVSKQALMDLAWKDAHVSETSLTEAVGLIRQALGDDPQQPDVHSDRAPPRLSLHRAARDRCAVCVHVVRGSPRRPPPAEPPAHAPAADDARHPSGRRRAVVRGLTAAAALLAIVALWIWIASRPAPAGEVTRVNVAFPAEQAPVPGLNTHPVVALSPDGRRLRLRGRRTGQGAAVPAGDGPVRRAAASGDGWRAWAVLLARWRLGGLLCRGRPQESTGPGERARSRADDLRDGTGCRGHVGLGGRDRVRAELAQVR